MNMNNRTWDYAIAAGLVAIAIMVVFGVRGKKEDPIPKQLWGYWTTDAEGYKDRYLELDDRYVLIGVSEEGMPDLQRVSKVNCRPAGERLSCIIYSSNSEASFQLTVDYSPEHGGEVHIKNQQDIVWHRQPSS
jgi:hypothetical protein